jgi:putative heme iron utilization protein
VLAAVDHDLSPILLLSDLAEHTKAIAADGRVSLLFDGTGGYPTLDELTAWVKARRPGTDVSVDGDIIRCVFDAT